MCSGNLAVCSDAQGVSGPSSSCVWNPRVFADDARGWQCPFVYETETDMQIQRTDLFPRGRNGVGGKDG